MGAWLVLQLADETDATSVASRAVSMVARSVVSSVAYLVVVRAEMMVFQMVEQMAGLMGGETAVA
jgi:hypothetical protein